MNNVKRDLSFSEKLEYQYNKEGWWLEAVDQYTKTVSKLSLYLLNENLSSQGLQSFSKYLTEYTNSNYFSKLKEMVKRVKESLEEVTYCLNIDGLKVMVYKWEDEEEYENDIIKTFEKFKNLDNKDYELKIPTIVGMDHVENEIINAVVKFYPQPFELLDSFYAEYYRFMDPVIERFSEEIQFYIVYLDFIKRFKQSGLKFCYPEVITSKDEIYLYEGFDLALAYDKIKKEEDVVVNDFWLKNDERLIVITGPNQGGKTTFARMFGQVHYLGKLGVPIPGRKAKIFLCDNIFTHFEREEKVQNLKGKLESDLLEVKQIIDMTTPMSLIILNETFSSATVSDAIFLAKNIISKILNIDCYTLYVTFLDEIASMGKKVISMVAMVSKHDPSIRTYKILRKSADGKAYAISMAEKYSLTYEQLERRLKG
ncbi:MAG TPA: DNA mismatch repair protein MutS [Clostridia bacterium]|nr:DNA mismatch repair protein MutS [Clostridia bacterium]